MKTITRFALIAAVLAGSFAFADEEAAPAEGGSGMRRSGYLLDRSPQERSMLLSVHAVVPYGFLGYGFPFGAGASFYIPIVKDGFIPPVNDEFGIDFGADAVLHLGYSSAPFSLTVPVAALWTFHFTDKLSAFVKLGVALRVWPGWTVTPVYAVPVSVVGLNFMFSKSFGLRAEVGYPMIKVGVLFAF